MLNRLCILCLSFLFLSSCATNSGKVVTDVDPQANFASYKTYSWGSRIPVTQSGTMKAGSTTVRTVMSAIRRNMDARGYIYVDDVNSADLALAFSIGANEVTSVKEVPRPVMVGYEPIWGTTERRAWGAQYVGMQSMASSYTEGSLGIDVFEVRSRAPVWHSEARKKLTKKGARSGSENIDEVVDILMEAFPAVQ